MIDVWLLFNLFKPFVDIIMQTYIETQRDQNEARDINHHGKTITVGDGEALGLTKVAPAAVDGKMLGRYENIKNDKNIFQTYQWTDPEGSFETTLQDAGEDNEK